MLGLTEDKLSEIFELAPLPIHILDTKGTLRWVNKEWQNLFGFRSAEVLGKKYFDFVEPDSREEMESSFQRFIKEGSLRDEETRITRKDGTVVEVSVNSRVIFEGGLPVYAHCMFFDISKRKHMEQELKNMTVTDYFTGLYNRNAIIDILSTEINRLDRYGGELSLLMVNINQMKGIINTYGHSIADSAVLKAAGAVAQYKRSSDSVGRYGGDKFIIVLPETGSDGAMVYAERLAYGISVPVGDGKQITVNLSLGIAEFTEDVLDADALIKNASDAIEAGKQEGRSTISVYGP
ncbi:MAG: GGDEF domain-containing protein [Thermodesulfovibrionales bacterium]|nr:GGDEF domain-containing protein [Thermodesulfovibrionales bacterium]